jgi:RNA polymerase sigma-70 factor (ECF subfamily)
LTATNVKLMNVNPTDANLGSRLAAGDRSVIALLYDRHAALCYRAASAACGSSTLAEDAVQEVFMRIARDPRGLASAHNVVGYLLRMAQHAAIDVLRRERRPSTPLLDATISAAPSAENGERDQHVAQALARLPEAQRSVVILRIWEHKSLEETGQILGINANTVSSRWRYAKEKLSELLKGFQHV